MEFWPIALQDRLPVIPVPLRKNDRDVGLDLQPLIDRVYENGRYDGTDYTRDPEPLLTGDDATWAQELLRKCGLR